MVSPDAISSPRLIWPKGGIRQRGAAALETVGALLVMFLAITIVVQFVVWQYVRGTVRAAAQEAARTASVFDAEPGACERRFESVVAGLLSGPLSEQVSEPVCAHEAELVTVSAEVRLERWLPMSPDWSFVIEAVAVREQRPGAAAP